MIPKKPSDIVKSLSEDLDISERLIEKLTDEFYKDLKNRMVNLEDPIYYVPGLGTFNARTVKIKKVIESLERKLAKMTTETMKKYNAKKTYEEQLEKLKELNKKLDSNIEKKKQFQNEKANRNLEK